MSASVADFRRDRVTSWVYIRSRTSDSRRVSSPSTSYSAVSTWSVIVDNRMVRTDEFSTRRSRSSAVDSSSSARHMISRRPSVSTTSCHSASPQDSSVNPRDMMNDLIAARSMTERIWSRASSGSRRYTLTASSKLEYGAQSWGTPITCERRYGGSLSHRTMSNGMSRKAHYVEEVPYAPMAWSMRTARLRLQLGDEWEAD